MKKVRVTKGKIVYSAEAIEFFRKTGAEGGKARAKKHSKAKLSEWARNAAVAGARQRKSKKENEAKD